MFFDIWKQFGFIFMYDSLKNYNLSTNKLKVKLW